MKDTQISAMIAEFMGSLQYIIPPRVVVSEDTFDEVFVKGATREPSEGLRKLMRDED